MLADRAGRMQAPLAAGFPPSIRAKAAPASVLHASAAKVDEQFLVAWLLL
jgi:hypothetical protein